MRTARAFPLAAVVAVTWMWPLPTAAQERDTARAAQDTVVPVYNLERIQVTITRIRSLVNRAPYALHVVDQRALPGEATIGLDETLGEVAGVWVNNRYNYALGSRVSIRGFGSRAQFGIRGIKLLLDGIPLTMADGQSQQNNIDMAAIGRVEVIRGPASSLYGNAAGGVISLSTEEPPAVVARPELSVLWGSYKDGGYFRKYVGKVGGRQGRFDYMASVSHFRTDGYREQSVAQTTVANLRGRWLIDGATELSAVLNAANTPVAQNPGSLPLSLALTNPDTIAAVNRTFRTGEKAHQIQGGLSLQRRLSAEHALRASAWGVGRELDNPIPFNFIRVDRVGGGARVETEFTPTGSRLAALIVGVEAEFQSDDRTEFSNVGGEPDTMRVNQDERVRSLGAFAQGAVSLGANWELTVGARYDAVRFKVEDHLIRIEPPDTINPDDSGSRTMSAVSPMIGLRFSALPWLNVYGNVTRSFETPTTTELKNLPDGSTGFNTSLDPQKAWGAEVGFKGTVAERLDYSLSNYCAWVSDELIPSEVTSGRSFFENAGTSRHCGIEAQVGWLAAEGLTASVTYAFSDFEFTEFVRRDSVFDGKRLPGVPVHQAHARLAYRSPFNVFGSVEVTYSDAYFADDANIARNPDYTLFDVRAGYSGRVGAWSFEPFLGVNNVFDTRYNTSVVINAAGPAGAQRYFEPGPGRTLYLGLRLPVQVGT